MERESLYRYIGNIFLITGYFTLLWVNPIVGLIIKCIGGALSVPFAVKYKLWDVVVICGFFFALDIAKLIQLIYF